jgi:hypothetical protein
MCCSLLATPLVAHGRRPYAGSYRSALWRPCRVLRVDCSGGSGSAADINTNHFTGYICAGVGTGVDLCSTLQLPHSMLTAQLNLTHRYVSFLLNHFQLPLSSFVQISLHALKEKWSSGHHQLLDVSPNLSLHVTPTNVVRCSMIRTRAAPSNVCASSSILRSLFIP